MQLATVGVPTRWDVNRPNRRASELIISLGVDDAPFRSFHGGLLPDSFANPAKAQAHHTWMHRCLLHRATNRSWPGSYLSKTSAALAFHRFPLPPEPRHPRPVRQQLLYRGLLDGPFLGDQRFKRSDQLVNVGEDGGDGALFRLWWHSDPYGRERTSVGKRAGCVCRVGYDLIPNGSGCKTVFLIGVIEATVSRSSAKDESAEYGVAGIIEHYTRDADVLHRFRCAR